MNTMEVINPNVEQGTPEWLQLRAGKVTASRVADVMSKLKNGSEAAGRRNYRAELVCERLTGKPYDQYCSADMQRGTELEPLARASYEIARDVMVEQVGFCPHPRIENFGASPDGLVGEEGLLEIKAPKVATHLDYLLGKVAPADYHWQMLSQMSCTGRKWVDFVSYCPELPANLALFVVRFDCDEERINKLEDEVATFLTEVEATLHLLGKIAEGR